MFFSDSPSRHGFIPPAIIRETFSRAMSDMYKKEVPLYGELLDIVRSINSSYMAFHPDLEEKLGSLDRVSEERHGAIRLGKPEELSMMARLFGIMGMHPVGYYDLSVAGLPVHSTAFRPVDSEELSKNPFRVFTSLLRMDLLDEEIRKEAEFHLKGRTIFTSGAIDLIKKGELQGGLTAPQADAFVREALETFRWHHEARVSNTQYRKFLSVNGLIADIVSFKGPHINHLTPRVLDIEALHRRMLDMGIEVIPEIQGPPAGWPILLQQTSFRALVEPIRFPDEKGGFIEGEHRARFGEIEQRHTALKPEAMTIYDRLTAEAKTQAAELRKEGEKAYRKRYPAMLTKLFKEAFPAQANDELFKRDWGYFTYRLKEVTKKEKAVIAEEKKDKTGTDLVRSLVEKGVVAALPVTYEDFLPVSAAGIFKSNLDEKSGIADSASYANRDQLENSLGMKIIDYHDLYRAQEEESVREVLGHLK